MAERQLSKQPSVPVAALAVLHQAEKIICFGSLALLALIPFADLVLRLFNIHFASSRALMTHLFLITVFFAASLTARAKAHIAIGVTQYIKSEKVRQILGLCGTMFIIFLLTVLAWNTAPYVKDGQAGRTVGIVPVWVFALAMPVGYFVMAVRFCFYQTVRHERIISFAMILAGTLAALPAIAKLFWNLEPPEPFYSWVTVLYDFAFYIRIPGILFLIIAALSGMPIFAAIGGIATLMLMSNSSEPEAFNIPVFQTLINPDLIAIPLFTLTGFFLSESKAGERLVKTFRMFLSWLPHGVVIIAVLISAFFSSFTGASGVTILALGGILYTIFRQNGYTERTSMGLLTAAGGTGVMFPPSLALILVASTSSTILHFMGKDSDYYVVHYFAGALIPGILLLLAMIITGIVLSSKTKTGVPELPKIEEAPAGGAGGSAFASLKDAAFELCLPLILLIGFFTGLLTPLQVSAVSVIYAAIVEVVIKKDIAFREIPEVFAKAVPVIGGVLIILAMSSGLSSAFVDSGIPDKFAAWVENTLQSKIAFLLLLNLALLLIGTVIDMFSAIMVLLPLVVPLGDVFGIHPVHLGIIFILNLEAGFMTPPVGINLFLASSRFGKPIMQICQYVIPFFLVRLAVLLLVAYIPWFSTWLPSLIK